MWWPSKLAYTIKECIVRSEYHMTYLTQLKTLRFDVMSIWRSLHNWIGYCFMWCPSALAYTIKVYIVCGMSIWPSLHIKVYIGWRDVHLC